MDWNSFQIRVKIIRRQQRKKTRERKRGNEWVAASYMVEEAVNNGCSLSTLYIYRDEGAKEIKKEMVFLLLLLLLAFHLSLVSFQESQQPLTPVICRLDGGGQMTANFPPSGPKVSVALYELKRFHLPSTFSDFSFHPPIHSPSVWLVSRWRFLRVLMIRK